jgi:hypothetical protein
MGRPMPDELVGERAALDVKLTELHRHKAT